jgi:hypothetical protein
MRKKKGVSMLVTAAAAGTFSVAAAIGTADALAALFLGANDVKNSTAQNNR